MGSGAGQVAANTSASDTLSARATVGVSALDTPGGDELPLDAPASHSALDSQDDDPAVETPASDLAVDTPAGDFAVVTPGGDLTLDSLAKRIGRLHVRLRLGLEHDLEAQMLRRTRHFVNVESWHSKQGLVRGCLRAVGLLGSARRNARRIVLRRNTIALPDLPPAFDGFVLLQLSDLHIDAAPDYAAVLIEAISGVDYDLCVLTGDYRALIFGPYAAALAGMAALRPHLKGTPYAVLGNHDTLRLVPGMEAQGYRLLLNEWTSIRRDGAVIYLAGIDDPHFYRLQNFDRAAGALPAGAVSILLSHTPETYRHAAHAGFDVMLCGHTHGGQICLPGGVPVLTDSRSPRRIARGAWRYHAMSGYTSTGSGTSLVDVRLNCPPEITLHVLRRLPPVAQDIARCPDG